MTILQSVIGLGALYAAFWATYVVSLPAWSLLRPAQRGRPGNLPGEPPRLAVIVPAHDMSAVIARCVESILAADYPADRLTVHVTADHCNDDTVERARAAGARVLVRDVGPPGKTYALAWTFDRLAESGVDADIYIIVDATARVDANFLVALSDKIAGGEDIVVSHSVVDPENSRWFAQCLGLTLVHRNVQNRAREKLALSGFIEGRGMAYSRRYIEQYGWRLARPADESGGTHPTEDWRHGVMAVEHGLRVAFADGARVFTPLRGSLSAATKQGVRWERGRMMNAYTYAVRLLGKAIAQRSRTRFLAALDAIQPPVAVLGGLCVIIAIAALFAFRDSQAWLAIGLAPLILVGLYGIGVVMAGRRDGIRPATVLWAPVYIAWRCGAFLVALTHLDRLLPGRTEDRKRV